MMRPARIAKRVVRSRAYRGTKLAVSLLLYLALLAAVAVMQG